MTFAPTRAVEPPRNVLIAFAGTMVLALVVLRTCRSALPAVQPNPHDPGVTIWVEHMGPTECWRLLAAHPVGRLGVLVDSAPEVYPVNHVVDGESIVFRTDPGSMLHGIDRSPSVCFEVDGFDLGESTGWSVLVKGRAQELTSAQDLEEAARLPLRFWSLGDKAHWIRIVPREVTGRRVHRAA